MGIDQRLELSGAEFPLKRVKGKEGRLTFRQTLLRPNSKTGNALVVEHNGHDHVHLIFRELYKTRSGKQGDRCYNRWTMDARESVALASVLMHMVEEHQRDSAEAPYTLIVDEGLAGFGPNWINEEYSTAILRVENRKKRSHLFGLMKRFIETCEDDGSIEVMLSNLTQWAQQSGDAFAAQQADKAASQLGLQENDENIKKIRAFYEAYD